MEARWRAWMLVPVIAGTLMACAKTNRATEAIADAAAERLLQEAEESVERIKFVIGDSRRGNSDSQFRLGMMILDMAYKHGGEQRGDVLDAAREWFTRSSEQGHDGSQTMLYQLPANKYLPDLVLTDSILAYTLLCNSPRHSGERPQECATDGPNAAHLWGP